MNNVTEKSGLHAAILFLVWPFLSLVSAFRNYDKKWAKNILWAFTAFYGFCFAIGIENQGSDIVRYVAEFEHLYNINMTPSDALKYYFESGEVDILRTFLAITLSRFTDLQAILTLVYGIIFGFFFSRNMWYVLDHLEDKLQPVTIILFCCFFLEIPIWEMNGFRMWTAAHIFIYGLLPFLFEGKKTGLLVSMSAILVHYSFIVPVAVLFGYLFLGNRLVLYFYFFVATLFFSEINIEVFNQMVEKYAPEIVQERSSSYRSETSVEEHRGESISSRVWYARWYVTALKWSVTGFLVLLYLKGRAFFIQNKGWLSLFSFALLFYGVANLLGSIPSGGRFFSIANLIALALIILYIQNRKEEVIMKRFVWVATPALLLFIIVAFRTGLYSMSATAILGNPVIALFLNGKHVSLNDVLKMIL